VTDDELAEMVTSACRQALSGRFAALGSSRPDLNTAIEEVGAAVAGIESEATQSRPTRSAVVPGR
jgi:hypothetical protein